MRRGKRAVELCRQDESAAGIVGEDTLIEMGYRSAKPIATIERNGQRLRYALITGRRALTLERLQTSDGAAIVTSYPKAAWMLLTRLDIPTYLTTVNGCVEAELQPNGGFDAAIELVQSGDSVRDNGLSIVADDLYNPRLMKIGKGALK